MTLTIDETGNKYGMLTVIGQAESHKTHAMWICRCDCGKERVTSGGHLRAGNTTNCGCARRLPFGESSFRSILHKWKRAAQARGLSWNLTEEKVRELTQEDCFYCGVEPTQIYHPGGTLKEGSSGRAWGPFIYNGIDRINNDIGYEPDNVVTSCFRCNRAKNVMSVQ